MAFFEFSPFGIKSIIVHFECDKCSSQVESEEIFVPSPDYKADSASESQTMNDGHATCKNCEKEFEIDISVTYSGGDGYINNLPDDYKIEVEEIDEPYYEEQFEAISSNTLFFQTFMTEIKNLKELNQIKIDDPSIDKTLRRQIFVGVIASMETYLSDAFIITTLNSTENIKNFVGTFHDFKDKPISLNELFDYHEKIETICKQAMLEVIYHNLPKVKGMYKDTLKIDLGDIGIPFKAVNTRHDLVHRNGKTKKGQEVSIDIGIIIKLIADIESFIGNIDKQIKAQIVTEEKDV